jgi:hypothetical protein
MALSMAPRDGKDRLFRSKRSLSVCSSAISLGLLSDGYRLEALRSWSGDGKNTWYGLVPAIGGQISNHARFHLRPPRDPFGDKKTKSVTLVPSRHLGRDLLSLRLFHERN